MSVITYFDKIIPYLMVSIDENKLFEQKNRITYRYHYGTYISTTKITHFSRSDNVICLPPSNTSDIINQLLASLYEKYQEDFRLSHASRNFSQENVEECNIHYNKIDLRCGATYIESPKWLKNKKATINPKNTKDVYCFMYAATIALYHDKLGSNPERISEKLSIYTQVFNEHGRDFPTSYVDQKLFEKLNEDIALNILYVPYEVKNICPEYISKRNFNTKKQIILLKRTDGNDKWLFLELPSISYEDGVKRPTKSLS